MVHVCTVAVVDGSQRHQAWVFEGRVDETAGHRDRLLAGMAQSIREQGFRQTTVADVVRLARTSRRTFYVHFEDREACFLELFDVMSEGLLAQIAAAADPELGWEEQVERALGAYLEAMGSEPALMRSYVREVAGLGERGYEKMRAIAERGARQLVELVERARERRPELEPLSFETATIVAGGFRELIMFGIDEGGDLSELHRPAADLIKAVLAPRAGGGQPRRTSDSSRSITS
jgi:AcrR family transcriptional regulator